MVAVSGLALRPLAPVRLRAARAADGGIALTWVRRSRQGFDWVDGGDAPLAEERELYRVRIAPVGGSARLVDVASPALFYSATEQLADAGGPVTTLSVTVAQAGALTGAGAEATAAFSLP